MKKFFGIVLMFLLIVGSGALLYADEGIAKGDITSYRLDVGDKFARGVKNILFGWTEIPQRMIDITKETGDPAWGAGAGLFQGTLKAMARTFSGVSDVVTAPITPEKGPLVSSEINVE